MSSFLADEDFPLASVAVLRAVGHDVTAIREIASGSADVEVLAQAVLDQRILLTLDHHFGRLIFREALPAPPGVVFFRYDPAPPREKPAADLLRLLSDREAPIEGHFVTLDRRSVRRRRLP